MTPLCIMQLLSIIVISALLAGVESSAVDDRCSQDTPCTPTDDDSYFCDYQIGPAAGGYCVACEGRQTYFCSSDETNLAQSGRVDCEEKCARKSCDGPCDEGYFCSSYNFQDGPCQKCSTLVVHPEECHIYAFPDTGLQACIETCPPKACSKRRHCLSNDAATKYFCNTEEESDEITGEPMGECEPCAGLNSIEECKDRSSSDLALVECTQVCEDVVVTSCSTNEDCREGYFCNSDICQACPTIDSVMDWHVDQCYNVTKLGLLDTISQDNCASSCHTECTDKKEGFITIEGLKTYNKDVNIPMDGTPYKSVSGPLVDCLLGGEGECPDDAPENFVCLVSRGARKFSDKALNCEEAGGIATVLYNNEESGSIVEGDIGDAPVEIPITAISLQEGQYLLEHGLGLETKVELKKLGDDCDRGCSDAIPCPSNSYCDYKLDSHGYCQECGADEDVQRVECFLSGLPLDGAQECASTCDSTLTSPSCKICGHGIEGSHLQSASKDEAMCNFCPDGLKKSHWDRDIPFIGSNATCYKLNQFFLNYEIAQNDPNCQLALNFNYICDCEGPGYAGANSDAKKKALVWLPRVSAILSFLGSSAIIIDVVRDKKKKHRLYGQLMATMSVFDLMGSTAYSLTTLPIPEEYYIEGSRGNDASCTAQGFFIQMGTISAFINVSLAVYYYCIIDLAWTETRIKRIQRWLFLVPITIGLIFAFAGIPFYGMVFVWCNNSAAWWPDIPIAVAILIVTCTMGSMCYFVWKTEKKSNRFTSESMRRGMSSVVFAQSIWYLLSFYFTWPPYLAIQYLWAAGSGYSSYGFVLFACMLVPLQGFWNSVVFFRVRVKKKVAAAASKVSSGMSRVVHSRHSDFKWRSSKARSKVSREGSAAVSRVTTTEPVQQSDVASGNNHSSDVSKPRVSWKSENPHGESDRIGLSELETIKHANGYAAIFGAGVSAEGDRHPSDILQPQNQASVVNNDVETPLAVDAGEPQSKPSDTEDLSAVVQSEPICLDNGWVGSLSTSQSQRNEAVAKKIQLV